MSKIPLKYNINVLFYTKYTHPTLICRGTDGRTDGHTENIYSIFRDKLLLLGEHGLRGFVVGRTFFIGVPFMTITDVAHVSATTCVMGIDGFLGCMLDAHICCHWFDKLSVTTEISSLSTTLFWVGCKVGSETNEFKHFTSSCSAPHHHILGN
jgi:hypothetical protein